jgi:predicted TIM-barrel enzyme
MTGKVTSKRQQVLERLRDNISRGMAIVGGGAGIGLSAKTQEAGGIDLIILYNSGRYRMAGRGSLAVRNFAIFAENQLINRLGSDALRRRECHHARNGP